MSEQETLLAARRSCCSASLTGSSHDCTQHIASLNVSKDKGATSSTATFAPTDQIFAAGHVANLPNKVTMQWQFIAEEVKGEAKNEHVAALDKSYDVDSDADVSYHLSPPPNGWPPGKSKPVDLVS